MSHGQAPRVTVTIVVFGGDFRLVPGHKSVWGQLWLLHLFSFVHTTFVAVRVPAS